MASFFYFCALHRDNLVASTKRIELTSPTRLWRWQRRTDLANDFPIYAHTIVRLYPFLAEIDCCRCPVRIMMVDWYEYDIFSEDVKLVEKNQVGK
jgi:hypothetical protein